MSIPKYYEIMLPLLKFHGDGKSHDLKDLINPIIKHFDLTPEEQNQRVNSGWTRIEDRIGWARTYLKKAGLIEATKRRHHRITDRGLALLKTDIDLLTKEKIIELYPDVLENSFYNPNLRNPKVKQGSLENYEQTPEESIEQGVLSIENSVKSDIIEEINKLDPKQFESLVVRLLVAMGYGTEEFSYQTNHTNDGGIDGVVQADELGFERVYIQAKKYESKVSRPDIQKFVGSMPGTTKGVFITTSDFANSVEDYLNSRPENIQLINGNRLVDLMYKHNQGVSIAKNIEIKSLDSDYFENL